MKVRAARADLLLSYPFLISLALLGLNDWVFKQLYPGWITGKLSDFAGVFALQVFLIALTGSRTSSTVFVAALFACWKSPISQPCIDAWNNVGLMQIGRVIDPSDLFALIVLLPHALRRIQLPSLGELQLRHVAVACAAFLLFCGTSKARYTHYKIDYKFSLPLRDLQDTMTLLTRVQDERFRQESSAVPLTDSAPYDFALVEIFGDEHESTIRLRQLPDEEIGSKDFERDIIHKLPGFAERKERLFWHDAGFSTMMAIFLTLIALVPLSIGITLNRSNAEKKVWRVTLGITQGIMFGLAILAFFVAILALISNVHVGGPA